MPSRSKKHRHLLHRMGNGVALPVQCSMQTINAVVASAAMPIQTLHQPCKHTIAAKPPSLGIMDVGAIKLVMSTSVLSCLFRLWVTIDH